MAEKNSKFMIPSLFHFIQILKYYRQNFEINGIIEFLKI